MKPRQQGYVPGLDVLRFFAACIVMIFHLAFWSWAYPAGQVARASQRVADFERWAELTMVGWAGVQIFFVISGFVIALSAEHASSYRFFRSRFVRLVPGAWICATIALVAWLLVGVGDVGLHFVNYARSMLFYPMPTWIDSVYWTLGVEICFYALVLALLVINRFRWLKPVICGIGLVSTMFWIAFWIAASLRPSAAFEVFSAIQWSRFSQLLLLQHGMFFAIGVLLWLHLTKRRTLDQMLWLCVFALGACLQIAGETSLKMEKTGIAPSPLFPCAVWLASMLFFWIVVKKNDALQQLPPAVLQLLRRLGLMTYPLYLLHNVTGGALMGTFVEWGAPTVAALWLAIACIVALSWWVSTVPEPWLQKSARTLLDSIEARWQSRWMRGQVREQTRST